MKTRGFCILFRQLGLEGDAQIEAARALVKIIGKRRGGLCAANTSLTKLARSHATVVVLREPNSIGYDFLSQLALVC